MICCLFVCGCDFTWQQYSHRKLRFSILLPRAWHKIEGTYNTTVIAESPLQGSDDVFKENINVTVTELPGEISLHTLYEMNKDEIMQRLSLFSDFDEGSMRAGLLAGRWFAFNSKVQNVSVRVISAIWVKDKRVYVVTCIALLKDFPAYEPIFKKAMGSLRIK